MRFASTVTKWREFGEGAEEGWFVETPIYRRPQSGIFSAFARCMLVVCSCVTLPFRLEVEDCSAWFDRR